MKHVAFPFLTLPDASVQASRWTETGPDGVPAPLGDYLAGWDYARDLRVSRTVSLQASLDATTLGFDPHQAELAVVVRAGTGPGSMPRRTWILSHQALRPNGSVIVDHVIPGGSLSSRLRLTTTVILAKPAIGSNRLAASRSGSILWQDAIDVSLEGTSPRFPMETVSFRERFAGRLEEGALWYLHWNPGQLHRDFGGSVRLYLNADRQDYFERFNSLDRSTLQVTLADVIVQMLSRALRDDDLEESLAEQEETSVAGHIAKWLELAFPGQSVAKVQQLCHDQPGSFHAAILAMADMQGAGDLA